MDAMMQVTTN